MRWLVQSILIPLTNLIVYGNFWIGLAAAFLFVQATFTFQLPFEGNPSTYFYFFSTSLLYAIHRTYGISKLKKEYDLERFKVIYDHRQHIWIYGFFFLMGALFFYFKLSTFAKLQLLIPSLLCLGYVLPLPFLNKRLRDIPFLKIFLICIIWSWTVSYYPFYLAGQPISQAHVLLLFLEKFCFLFAITIPFDIRDIQLDSDKDVATIASHFGVQKSILLSIASIVAAALISLFIYPTIAAQMLVPTLLGHLATFLILLLIFRKKHDLYFSGLLDGTMIIHGLLTIIFLV